MGKSSVSDLSEHVFDLIQELFAIDPMLLTSVMPQLEFKLKVTNTRANTHMFRARMLMKDRRADVEPLSNIIFCFVFCRAMMVRSV